MGADTQLVLSVESQLQQQHHAATGAFYDACRIMSAYV